MRRPPRRLPLRLVDEAGPEPDPSPDPQDAAVGEPVRRRGWRRVRLALVTVAVVVLLVECAAIVRSVRSSGPEEEAAPEPVIPLVAPSALPDEGSLVQSEVRADGSIAVTQWIRSPGAIDGLSLSAPVSGTPRAVDVRLVAADGTVLVDDLIVGAAPRQVEIADPTRLVRATYVLRGAVDRSGTVDGRVRALLVSLDVDFAAEAGPTVVVVSGGAGEVLNLACANARSAVALLRPCGEPDGAGWRVRLPAGSREDRVTAQVDLP